MEKFNEKQFFEDVKDMLVGAAEMKETYQKEGNREEAMKFGKYITGIESTASFALEAAGYDAQKATEIVRRILREIHC